VKGALDNWFSHGDVDCPGEGTYMIGESVEGCTSDQGWYYLGVGGYDEAAGEDENGALNELTISGDLAIIGPALDHIDIGGRWNLITRDTGTWRALVNGSWLEPENNLDWLATGMSAWLEYYLFVDDAGDNAVSMQGVLTLRGTSMTFEDVILGRASCNGVPIGLVTVRDPDGGSWAIDFGEACTPCGTVSFEGEVVETDACLTLDKLADRIIGSATAPVAP
jgi:hypothetical protein